ncbi:serine O-acetyltransferase [Poriferisphaera sp. WC338]|uniref:serine O-acetyltransferase n=1 Tax=Poriferisphaera sp. WC338 TaxID=3425129 RepID=UPI003D8172B2
MVDKMDDTKTSPNAFLSSLADQLISCYQQDACMQHLNATFLPNRAKTIEVIELLRRIIFPGFFDEQRITTDNVNTHVNGLLQQTHTLLHDQIHQSLRYQLNEKQGGLGDDCDQCESQACEKTAAFMKLLPNVRRMLSLDVQATFDGDPASVSTDENIFCYPGIDAIFTYRIAHELYKLKVPLLPRIMTEYAHNETGIEIHPGAIIGERFCIDHGTGIVIGETCNIGNNVKIYQGVTLGALSTKGGQDWRGMKRHPNIEDDVTIYPNATILGGSTTIGKGATIGGSVFITASIPAGHRVTSGNVSLNITPPKTRKKKRDESAE